MKRVLLTNNEMIGLAGSQIDTNTVANYFLNNGWEVDIFTLEYGKPMTEHIDKNVRLITPDKISVLYNNYDLIWAHHYPLLDYILFVGKIKAKKILYISLSPFEPFESFPEYYMDLSVIATMSEMSRKEATEEGCKRKDIIVIPNYATEEYFKNESKIKRKIKKICIVSNHVPQELYDFRDKAIKSKIDVDIYGVGNTVKLIDIEVLKQYDVVISIGKTIFYSTAACIPSYCYDHFGGYGYIIKNNIKKCYERNYSGRWFGFKKTGDEIFEDILSNYQNACNDLEYVKSFAKENYCFEDNMEKILKKLEKMPDINYDNLYNKYPLLFRKSKLFVERIYKELNFVKSLGETFTFERLCYENEMKKLNEEIRKLNCEIKKQKHEKEKCEVNLNQIQNSKTWRILLKIRKVKKLLFDIRTIRFTKKL